MKHDRWKQIDDLLEAALQRPAAERAALLDEACAGDQSLRDQVESLLAADARAGSLVGGPAAEIAAQVLDETHFLAAGHQIGHYKIDSLVGKGGMGAVYLAEDLRLGRRVALKLLPDYFTKDERRVRRFEQEARAVSSLNHPNILVIHDIGVEDHIHYMATEFIEGETLRDQVSRARMSVREALDVAVQVASALAEAHQAGIIHRDIKPENIMLRADGLVKVLDFGLAKLTAQQPSAFDGEALTLGLDTEAGTILGTASYMSPEQARGRPVDARSDIFSLAVVLYEMIAGRAPFEGETMSDLIASILKDEPKPLSEHSSDIPRESERILNKALRKDRDARYQTVAELLGDLKQLKTRLEFEAELARSAAGQASPPFVTTSTRHTVGRDKERSELRGAFESVSAGGGLVLCVTGEPGIGKTTLVEDFLGELSQANQPCTIARGKCSERLAGTEAYLPLLEALDSLLGSEERDAVVRLMKQLAPHWYDQVVPPSAPASSDSNLAERATISQAGMKRELGAFCQELAGPRPLVLFFDDLHWADPSTIDLLGYLACKFEAMRLLIIVTYRQSDLLLAKHPFLQLKPDLQARGVCHEIPLEFLSRTEIEKYLELEFPEHRFPGELSALIHTKTEGSPLFMVDLVRYLGDRRVITQDEGRWVLARSGPEIEQELPESVRGMIERKISQLTESDRRLLVAASVQGYEFDSAVLTQALSADAADVEERLEGLEHIHAFVRLVEERAFPEGTLTLRYRFIHVLYQNALYATLRPTRRIQLSASVAESLIAFYGDKSASAANEIAVLYEVARNFARSADYFQLAAQNASLGFASKEAVVLARRGLSVAEMLPEGRERDEREISLQLALGSSLVATRGYAAPEVEEAFSRAHELCKELGKTPQLLPMLVGLWVNSYARASHRRALELATELLGLAEQHQDPAIVVGHRMLGCSLLSVGEVTRARDHFERSISLYDPALHRSLTWLYGNEPGMAAHSYLGFTLLMLGYPDQAMEQSRKALRIVSDVARTNSLGPGLTQVLGYPDQALTLSQEALRLGRQVSHANSLGLALTQAALHHQFRGESRQVGELAEAITAVSSEQGLSYWSTIGTILHGWAIAEQGQNDDGIGEMERGLHAHQSTGHQENRPYYLSLQAESYGKAGRPREGLTVLAQALALVEKNDERLWEAELHRLRGELLLQSGVSNQRSVPGAEESGADHSISTTDELATENRQSEPETCFHRAIEIARRQEAKSFELRAVMSLARLWQNRGNRAEAEEMLAGIYGWFTEGFETADLRDARALLNRLTTELGESRSASAQPPVRSATNAGSGELIQPSEHKRTINWSKRHRTATALVLVTVIIAAATIVYYLSTSVSRKPIESLVILPFDNANNDPNTEYLSDGITETLINSFSQLPRLRVMARTTAFRYKGKATDPQQAGHELGVQAVLTGKVAQQRDNLIVQVELIDVTDGSQIWGGRYTRKLSDILTMQDEIARSITERLRLKLTGEEQRRLTKQYTDNTEAYSAYLQGRYWLNKRSPDGVRRARDYFNQAIAADADYALAYSGLADYYATPIVWRLTTGRESDLTLSSKEAAAKAKDSVLKALSIDDQLSEAHASMGFLMLFFDWNWSGAEREFHRALELNPNYSLAHAWHSSYLSAMGRHQEAIAEAKRAVDLDPFSPANRSTLGAAFCLAREYDQAIDQLKTALELDRESISAYPLLRIAYERKGMSEDALRLSKERLRGYPNDPNTLARLARDYALVGKTEEAKKALRQLEASSQQHYASPFFKAIVYDALRDPDRVFQLLHQACEQRESPMIYINVYPDFSERLRPDPRFRELLRCVGLAE